MASRDKLFADLVFLELDGHGPHVYEGEKKTFVDFLKPEYKY
jgi:hypothetical protein